jgi:acyl carrier protein
LSNISLDTLKPLIAEQLDVNEQEIFEAARFKEDLGADSLDVVELIMELENEMSVDIPDEEAEKLLTVGDVLSYFQSKED